MKVYILRHGITEWNALNKLQGSADIPLAQEGVDLARKTGEAVQGIPFDLCYTSPLSRAVKTAKHVLYGRNVPMISDQRLAEIEFGELEGTVYKDTTGRIIHKEIETFFDRPLEYRPLAGGESIHDIMERTGDFWRDLTSDPDLCEKHILISTHGCASRALLQQVTHDPENYWRGCVPPNCSISLVEVTQSGQSILFTDRIFA